MNSLRRIGITLVLTCVAALSVERAAANEQADQLVTGKKLLIKHKSDPTKSKIVFISKDSSFVLPNMGGNPTVEGATLQVLDMATGTGPTFNLAAAMWSEIPNGYKYKNPSGSPCRVVIIKLGKLIKGVCKGAGVTLNPPLQNGNSASAGVILRVGTDTIRYCAVFPNPLKNETNGSTGTFIAKNSGAPAACPFCGNGTVNAPDEGCDDGNNVNGDCCNALCQTEPNGNACDDGDPCTTGGTCVSGSCSSAPACGNNVTEGACGEQCDGTDDNACDAPGLCGDDCNCVPAPTCDADPARVLFIGFDQACETLANQGTCETAYIRSSAGVTSCYWDGGDCLDCDPSSQAEGLCRNTCDPVTCPSDSSRTVFIGGPGNGACRQFDGDQASCEQAFHQTAYMTVASCYYDTNTDECRGCGPQNQGDGDCTNTCAACTEDPSRTIHVGGPEGPTDCSEFDGDEASCNQAFQFDDQCAKPTSCFYDGFNCQPCDLNNQLDGVCQNTCEVGPADCAKDPTRTVLASNVNGGACHAYDGDPNGCVTAYHHTQYGNAASCYYDFADDECRGCGPGNVTNGECINTCLVGAPDCAEDPSRKFFVGGPGNSACQAIESTTGAQVFCEEAFHLGREGFASCYWDGNDCRGCGLGNEGDGACQNTCAYGPTICEGNPARTLLAGPANSGACDVYSSTVGDSANCDAAFHVGRYGISSCHFDNDGTCHGCNFPRSDECTNECDPPSCDGDPARNVYAGGINSSACHQFDNLPAACNQAFHIGANGIASCYYDADNDECLGCGPNNEDSGQCTNTCPLCAHDPSRTNFVGGPNTSACHEFDNNQAGCEGAFHYDQNLKPTSCYFDADSGDCNGCGSNRAQDGVCQNTCEFGPNACTQDPVRTLFAGNPNSAACHQYDGDPINCALAFHRGSNGIASCYYSAFTEECSGCGPNNQQDGNCINSCMFGPIACEEDPSRNVFVGGPNTSACHLFDGDQAGCEQAYHMDSTFRAASCWWDAQNEECRGCGPSHAEDCTNTCAKGPIDCANDSSRSFIGGPQTGACFEMTDENSCLSAFHVGQCGEASCYWTGSNCQGCGPQNNQNLECFNTCVVP